MPRARGRGHGLRRLSRGLLSGHWSKERAATAGAFRQNGAAFTGDNLDRNLALVEARCARSPSPNARRSPTSRSPGCSHAGDIRAARGSASQGPARRGHRRDGHPPDVRRPRGDQRAMPAGAAAGDRYHAPQMATLDSERSGIAAGDRGRPDARGRMLETAEDVLRRFGPAKATVVDVARALDVSHGSVYRHFPSKAALRDAVAERWLARISEPLQAVAEDEDGLAPERLRRWLDLLIAAKRAARSRIPSCSRPTCSSWRSRARSSWRTCGRSPVSSPGSSTTASVEASSRTSIPRSRVARSSTRRPASTTRPTRPSGPTQASMRPSRASGRSSSPLSVREREPDVNERTLHVVLGTGRSGSPWPGISGPEATACGSCIGVGTPIFRMALRS